MIIDLICSKKETKNNKPLHPESIRYILEECRIFEFDEIAAAINSRNNDATKKALCNYIDRNGYNPNLKEFINNTIWFMEV